MVTALSFTDDGMKAFAKRQVEGGSEILEASLPLLVTCQKGLNEPRLPSLKGIMTAKKKEIKILNSGSIQFDPTVLKHIRARQTDLSLPPKKKKGIILKGSIEASASQLVKILRENVKVI